MGFKALLAPKLSAAGITIDNPNSYDVNIQVKDERVYRRVIFGGTLGLGESYMDGDWDCEDLAGLFSRLVRADLDKGSTGIPGLLLGVSHLLRNAQNMARALQVAHTHYDLGNKLYQAMLGSTMAYTCAYYGRGASTLDQAQEAKFRLICEKLDLKPGDRVLDIGCGFGSFAKFAAKNYQVEVVGITISKEQLAFGWKFCEGLNVDLIELDYRHLRTMFGPNHFDHVVSIGMFEAVGPKNFKTFMRCARSVMKEDGLFLLHTIGMRDGGADPWIERYIFNNGVLPSIEQIVIAAKGSFDVVEDFHNFGPDYCPTLLAWARNFEEAWPALKASKEYDDRFYRMWRYYLYQCAGLAQGRQTQLWQFVLSPHGVDGVYRSVR